MENYYFSLPRTLSSYAIWFSAITKCYGRSLLHSRRNVQQMPQERWYPCSFSLLPDGCSFIPRCSFRAALDFHYSKTLKKISANLHKATHQAESDIDKGWTSVAEQFDVQATIHSFGEEVRSKSHKIRTSHITLMLKYPLLFSNLGSALTDDVIQPLRSIQSSEAKTIRAAAIFVEREARRLKDRKDATTRTKRVLYECSKQLEKLEQANDQQPAGERANVKKRRIEEQVKKQEENYLWETVDLEKQRRLTEGVLRKGVESLEAIFSSIFPSGMAEVCKPSKILVMKRSFFF
ncbi:hypothetical protein ANCCEY_07827 [Ancylostoma ceylanicum]|uniref:BAR domain-containing protein n=1 Tax=Ancylostoma ceylanicum TaxID=53326 RepID=A0A0D6LMJ0_9BILA|nr:hypothetical protein ANCCEY_07827 [Ancylostoma ceylanicum]